jgi:putative ABC transport system permease protein
MTRLALHNLISEKTRFAFSAAGIGFAVFLITILLGLYRGWNDRVGGFVEHIHGDAWVARQGTTDFINAASILPISMKDDLAKDSRVETVGPMIVRPMTFHKGSEKVDVHLIGYDVASGIGGPIKVTKGRDDPHDNEIIIDEVLSRVSDVHIGDQLTTGTTTLNVIGIATGGNFIFTQAGFMSIESAQSMLQMGGLTTFFLVKLKPGTDVATWQTSAQDAAPGTTVFRSQEFASATRHRILDNVVPIILLILGLAFIVGIAITSLTIYTTTVERTREFGVMKAIGFNNMDLYKLVFWQALITGGLGFVFGALITLVLSRFIDQIVAQFIVLVQPLDILFVLLATLVMAVGAAVVPARRVGAVDPAVVFRG